MHVAVSPSTGFVLDVLTPSLFSSQRRLREAGFDSHEDLEEYLNKIEKSLTRAKNKELGIEEESKASLFPPLQFPYSR